MSPPPPLPDETYTSLTHADRFHDELISELARLDPEGLLRRLKLVSSAGPIVTTEDGKQLVNFTSNSYLGINEHASMKAAAVDAVNEYGTGAGASLLISGRLPIHAKAERDFAEFKHAEAAILLPSGYTANLAALTALAGPGDLICLDKLCHASLIDAARASGAEVRTYPHLMTEKLERLLQRHHAAACGLARNELQPSHISDHTSPIPRPPRRFIVTDSVFSMDGDTADLPTLCDLAEEYDAVMVVDEAHGTGLLGKTGAGLCEAQGVVGRVQVTISTASKALGGLGGIITASRPVVDTIINHARALIYTTAIPPAQAAAIEQSIRLVQQEPQLRRRVRELTIRLREGLKAQGWTLIPQGEHVVPIVPLVVGQAKDAVALAEHCYAHGILAAPIRPPTVAPGSSRVRLSLRADMDEQHVDQALSVIAGFTR